MNAPPEIRTSDEENEEMIDQGTIRYARRQRAYGNIETQSGAGWYDEIVDDALASDAHDATLDGIRTSIDMLGYVCIGHVKQVMNWIADQPVDNYTFSRKVHRCQRCHRELTDPESIALGIGPECRKVMGVAA